MFYQCLCCGYFSNDHLQVSKHMKEYHDIKVVLNEKKHDPNAQVEEWAMKLFYN